MTAQTVARRGTSNKNVSGNSRDRRRRREWLVVTFRADVDLLVVWPGGAGVPPVVVEVERDTGGVPACRCYRCGVLMTVDALTVDRIVPGCQGGTYRRNNIRPACGPCNSETGGALASHPKRKK
ncbi:HNH endonuclease signature motif containing protein [Nocardioides sp. STR2]|uniref:HNH endonuclease signature motif containing protein n=1 Tax=Nocardioides pini TaxID=2975053 RepID=A0ABT4CCN7_9ACTN|nr:HNH endonuclease signature motif containing protein [Nocardioides pini]MCY4726718.1 HNH endonuclease signature motif containing protein [Nocardioides pini]